ncbi:MAG: GNAT family N-acetyltransferase [Elusimicrobia bacterium]|jgi:ribosomal-protein-alanine N-acetyltransferase|nr:GNAT family N-acetyltransferase [Elusimicrobiota bacterium]
MQNIESLQIQRREVSENIRRVTKEIIMMEEVLKETDDNIMGLEFQLVSKESDRWNDIVNKARKFRERIAHLKSERRRFIRMEQSYENQIKELQKEAEIQNREQENIKELETKKEELAIELQKMSEEREKTEGVLKKLNQERKEREEKIQQAAIEEEKKVSSKESAGPEKSVSREIEDVLAGDIEETQPEQTIENEPAPEPEPEKKEETPRRKLKTLKDLAKMYKTIDKKEKETQESEEDITFPPPKPLDKLKFSISEFSAPDLKEVIDIETFSFPRPWRRYMFYKEMEIPVSRHYVLKANDGISRFVIAYCVYWVTNKKMNIKNFASHPSYRLQGVGTKFLKAMINKAKGSGAVKANVIVRESNTAALELVKKLDFRQGEKKKEYFGFTKEDGIVMEREI